MEALYSLMMQVFNSHNRDISTLRILFTSQLLLYLVLFFQNIQFCYTPNLSYINFESFNNFWTFITYFSLNSFAARYSLLDKLFYVYLIILYSSFIAFGIGLRFSFNKKKIHNFYALILRMMLFVLSELLFLPILACFFIVIKHSIYEERQVLEFVHEVDWNSLNFGITGEVFSFFGVFILVILFFIYEAGSYDLRHNTKNYIRGGKFNCKSAMISKINSFVICLAAFSLRDTNYRIFLCIYITGHAICAGFDFYSIPYYYFYYSWFKFSLQIDCCFVALVFFIGDLQNNSLTILVISIIMQPMILCMSFYMLKYRMSKIQIIQDNKISNIDKFELMLRKIIKNDKEKEKILRIFDNNFHLRHHKLKVILESYFCTDILCNCTLGHNKISQISHSGFDIFSNFQVFKCKKVLETSCEQSSPGYKLYKYFSSFEKAMKHDQVFCKNLYLFMEEITNGTKSVKVARGFMINAIKELEKVIVYYENLFKNFPESTEVAKNYANLLNDFINDFEKADFCLKNLKGTEIDRNMQKINYSISKGRCFFVVSGNYHTLGKFIFYNFEFLKFLDFTQETLKEIIINNIMPIKRDNHTFLLYKFLNRATSHKIFTGEELTLLDSKGFLKECKMICECISYKNTANFLCIVDPLKGRIREIALLNSEGMILFHSEKFPLLVSSPLKFIENIFLNEFFTGFSSADIIENHIKKYELKGKTVYTLIKIITIGKTDMITLLATSDKNEKKSWKANIGMFDEKKVDSILNIDIKPYQNIKNMKNSSIRNKDTSSKSITNINLSKKEIQLLSGIRKILNLAKWILLFTICVIISSLVVTYLSLSKEATHSNELTVLIDLGKLAFHMSQAAIITRTIDFTSENGLEDIYTIEDAKKVINDLRDLQGKIIDNYNSWSYCSASNIVKEEKIKYWYLDGTVKADYANLYQLTEYLIENIKLFLKSVEEGNNYNKEALFFVVFNFIGRAFTQIYNTIGKLSECEQNRSNDLSVLNYTLMSICGVCLGICFIIIIAFITILSKKLNDFWDFFSKKIYTNYEKLYEKLDKRTSQCNFDIKLDNRFQGKIFTTKKTKNEDFLRYLKVFSLVFIFGVFSYFIGMNILFKNLQEKLIYKPLFLNAVIKRRIEVTELAFFTLENELQNTNNSLLYIYPNFTDLKIPLEEWKHISAVISSTKYVYANPLFKKILSPELYNYVYRKIPGVSTFLSIGTNRGIHYLIHESRYIVFNNLVDDYLTLSKFINSTIEYTNELSFTSNMANDDSMFIIYQDIEKLKMYTAIVSCICAVLYFFVCRPFLNKEIFIIEMAEEMARIVS